MYNSSILRQYLIIQKLKPKFQELPGASLLAIPAYFEYTKKILAMPLDGDLTCIHKNQF